MRPWYNLAVMQNAAATMASQNGNWKLPETKALMLMPMVKFEGRVRFAELTRGILMSSIPAIEVMISKPARKVTMENKGFL